jgi:hypothetical protein
MTPQKILSELADSNIEICILGGDLKIIGDPKVLPPDRVTLIKRHKLQLMDFLRSEAAGSVETVSGEQKSFKQYEYHDGQLLRLNRDEFYRVVDAVRILIKMANEQTYQGPKVVS